jgi:hypothetical protein
LQTVAARKAAFVLFFVVFQTDHSGETGAPSAFEDISIKKSFQTGAKKSRWHLQKDFETGKMCNFFWKNFWNIYCDFENLALMENKFE